MSELYKIYPLLIIGGVTGLLALIFIIAFATMKNKKEAIGFDRNMKDGEIIKRLAVYAKPHMKSFVLVFVIMLVSIAYDVISPLLVGKIEKVLEGEFEMSYLLAFVSVYAVILIVSLVSSYVQAILLQKIGQKILSSIREDVFTHIESLSHAQLNSIPVGKLVTRVANDTGAISMMFTHLLVNLIKNCFIIVGVFAAMLCLNYMLTLVVLCFVPVVVLFTFVSMKFARRAHRRVRDATTDVNTFLSENLSGIKITQVFNNEEAKLRQFKEKNDVLGRAKIERTFVHAIFRPLVYMLYISSVILLLYFGAKGVIRDVSFLGQKVSADIIISFYMYINKFFDPIQNLAEQFNQIQASLAAAEKIFSVIDTEPEIKDSPDAIDVGRVEGNIEFRNVWFAYNPGEWVLKGVSFTVKAGQTVALVGATGSGKTTILSLLCRNYEVDKGEILVDGINIKNITAASLRRNFGQMLQDVFLFSGTVRSNIVLRDESITDLEVEKACEYVNADRFISKLSRGLDEEVRERGNNFSQGQRQLLSFARTIVRKPSVMILDEATANIDTETELLIRDSLEKMMNIGTMIIVAHRLSTVRRADKIIVLSEGEIAEEGTHSELLSLGGKYHKLYTLQYEREEEGK